MPVLAANPVLPDTKHLNPELITARAFALGFRHARYDELCDGLRIAEAATGERLSTADALSYVDSVTQLSNWVTGDPVDGVFVAAPLSDLGAAALLDGSFDVERPLKIWLSQRGRDCAGLYIGIVAGQSSETRRRLMMTVSVLRSEFFADVYCFARGVTDEGRRAMQSMGMTPHPHEGSSLFVQAPRTQNELAA